MALNDENTNGASVPTYSEAFPALPMGPGGTTKNRSARPAFTPIRTSHSTEVFYIPTDEQRFRDSSAVEKNPEPRICKSIGDTFNVDVECSRARDGQLTVIVTGKRDKVMQAKVQLMKQLQSPSSDYVAIPTEHHRFIIGTGGQTLQELQRRFGVTIRVPKTTEEDKRIQVEGPKDSVKACADHIYTISDEKAKKDVQRLPILKAYHQLISGPKNANLDLLKSTYPGIRINIPPMSVDKDEIIVTGEKESVARAVVALQQIYDEKRRTCAEYSAEIPKSQHRFIIGPRAVNLHEIEEKTGVVVDLPRPEDKSNMVTIRGPQANLAFAWRMVKEKADSMVVKEIKVPDWLHRHIIGKKGENVRQLRTSDKIGIKFQDGDVVEIEGPPAEVAVVEAAILKQSAELQATMTYADIPIDPTHRGHIVGKEGSVIGKIKADSGCQITMPRPDSDNNNLRIEGPPAGVEIAKAAIMDLIEKQKNFKSVDVIIPFKFHNLIIGAGGSAIRELQNEFDGININIPQAKLKSDIVVLRGDRKVVDGCEKKLKKMLKQFELEGFVLEVPVIKQYHRNIIGKGGAVINEIKDATKTRINIPDESSESNIITITGTEKNCEAARERILKIQDEISSIVEETLEIDTKFHGIIIGPKGSGINAIMKDCNVIVRVPSQKAKDNKIVIKGNPEDVKVAKERIMDIATGGGGHTMEVTVPRKYHRILNGRGGTASAAIQKETGGRLLFPLSKDSENDVITIMGTEEGCEAAKKLVLARVEELENTIEKDFPISEYKYVKEMKAQQMKFLKEMRAEFAGVDLKLPKSEDETKVIKLKGAVNDVELAIVRLNEFVDRVDNTVTLEMPIARSAIPAVMGAKGKNVRQVTSDFNVDIKFPKRRERGENGAANGNGAAAAEEKVLITGLKQACEQAMEALQAFVPCEETMTIPPEYHRFLIGTKGDAIRALRDEFEVLVKFPSKNAETSDQVLIKGLPANIASARAAIESRMEELKEEIAQNHRATAQCDKKTFPLWLADGKAELNYVQTTYNVKVELPRRDAKKQDTLTIIGYEESANEAISYIENRCAEFEDMYVWEQVDIAPSCHSRIIGSKGSNLRKLQGDYNVVIQLPRGDTESATITVVGAQEDVDACIEELKDIEEEDGPARPAPSRVQQAAAQKSGDGPLFSVRDAPWDKAPDTEDTSLFPSLGSGQAKPALFGAWSHH